MFFKKHQHKWGAPVDRHQTCLECGEVRTVECPHKWRTTHKVEAVAYFGGCKRIIFIQECEHCGKIRQEEIE